MESNLPATGTEVALAEPGDAAPGIATSEERAPAPVSRPVGVAFLPLALAAFVILAFVMAAWTFLAAAP